MKTLRKHPLLYRLLKPLETHRLTKVSQLIKKPGLKVLDIGCADGDFLYRNKSNWLQITGIDIDGQLIKKAKEKEYGRPSRFFCLDINQKNIPIPDKSVDLVTCIAMMQYVSNLDMFLAEINRVLIPDGSFILEVPNAGVVWRRIRFLFGRLPKTGRYISDYDEGVLHYFTLGDLTDYLKCHGFKVDKIIASGIFDKIRERWPSLLGADLIIVAKKNS